MATPTFDQYLRNLKKWVETPQEVSDIKFIFYATYDQNLTTPKIRLSQLMRWEYMGETYYVSKGYDANFVYVYPQSDLKVLIRLKGDLPGYSGENTFNTPKNKLMTYNVNITTNPQDSVEAYVGSHLDFSISKMHRDDVLFKTHFTAYAHWGTPAAERILTVCNFVASSVPPTNILDTMCFGANKAPTGATVQSSYAAPQSTAIQGLYKILKSGHTGGATHRGRRYKIRTGSKGGRYIVVNGRTIYIASKKTRQSGGVAPLEYNDIRIDANNEEAIFSLLQQTCINRVWESVGDRLEAVRVFYDQNDELNPNGHAHIAIIYEFAEDKVHVFFVEVMTLLRAFYATQHPARKVEKELMSLVALQEFDVTQLLTSGMSEVSVAA